MPLTAQESADLASKSAELHAMLDDFDNQVARGGGVRLFALAQSVAQKAVDLALTATNYNTSSP